MNYQEVIHPKAGTSGGTLDGLRSSGFLDRVFVIVGLVVSSLIAIAYLTDSDRTHLWPVALAITVTALRPVWGLTAFIFILPFFGNRPTTEQFHLLLMIGAGVNATLAIRHLRSLWENKQRDTPRAVFSNPLLLMVFLYLLVSIASLTSLPWKHLLLDFQSAGGANIRLLPEQVRTFLNSGEGAFAYSILTVILTLQSLLTAFFVYVHIQRETRHATTFCLSFVAGLTVLLFAGVLDFYHLINLEFFRPLDPNINPGGLQVRLQSFMGYSSWLAEYIVLAIPYVLILLLNGRSRIRVWVFIFLLMLGVFASVLTYQRGGWITYLVTLWLVCLSFSWVRLSEKGTRKFALLRRLSLKALATLALVLFVPLATIYFVNKTFSDSQRNGLSNERYAQRVVEIKNVWDRMVFFRAGYRLGLVHPFLGGGSEGFHFLYEREFLNPQGRYFNDPISLGTFYGTAHNVYMQTFSGKGLWGLAFLLLPVIYLVGSGLKFLTKPEITRQQKLIMLISICACGAFFVYGNTQEFFYIQSLQYMFFITLAIFAASLSTHLSLKPRYIKSLWAFLAVGLIAHLAWEYGYPGQTRKMWQGRPEFGCYEPEQDAVGRFNWCGRSFRQKFPVSHADGEPTALLSLGIVNPKPDPPLVNVRVELAAHEVVRYQLHPNAHYFLPVVIPPALRSLVHDNQVVLKVMSDNLFNPAYDTAGSKDYRFLSIRNYQTVVQAADHSDALVP